MKEAVRRFLALTLVFVVVLSFVLPTFAFSDVDEQQRASNYISYVYAHTSINNGYVKVYFAITGTGTMDSLGATAILIYDSDDDCVACLDSSNTSGLMGYNRGYYSNTVTGPIAVSGEHYYAIVGFKAANSSGYDTTAYATSWT